MGLSSCCQNDPNLLSSNSGFLVEASIFGISGNTWPNWQPFCLSQGHWIAQMAMLARMWSIENLDWCSQPNFSPFVCWTTPQNSIKSRKINSDVLNESPHYRNLTQTSNLIEKNLFKNLEFVDFFMIPVCEEIKLLFHFFPQKLWKNLLLFGLEL